MYGARLWIMPALPIFELSTIRTLVSFWTNNAGLVRLHVLDGKNDLQVSSDSVWLVLRLSQLIRSLPEISFDQHVYEGHLWWLPSFVFDQFRSFIRDFFLSGWVCLDHRSLPEAKVCFPKACGTLRKFSGDPKSARFFERTVGFYLNKNFSLLNLKNQRQTDPVSDPKFCLPVLSPLQDSLVLFSHRSGG